MDNKSDNEVSVSSSTFYPEKIIFCIDISGEMNKILEFNDLPYPNYNNLESDFQPQKLSVPNSPNGSPMSTPPLPPRPMTQTQEPVNTADLLNLNDDFNAMSVNNNTNNQAYMNSFNTATVSDVNIKSFSNTQNNNNNNNNNTIYNMDYSNIESNEKNQIKSFTNSAKKLLKRSEKDENGNISDNNRSNSPIKNFIKGNNDNNSITGSPDNRRKSNSSLNFLKSSYSNVVQNVFNSNHSRASSNASTSSFGSLSNAAINKDFPALKQPIELTRLEAVKRYIKRFVSLKGSLCKEHQYALVLLGVDAIWFNDFTSDYKNIINVIEEIPAQEEYIMNFDMDSLLNLMKERNLIPNILTSSHFLRVVFLYSRPTIPTININNVIFKQLQESKLFMFDCVYFHEKKNENFNPQIVFNELLKMEDPSNPSLFFDVIRNGQKFSIAMMKLLGHPLQRRIK